MPVFHFTVISERGHDVRLGVVLDGLAAARAHAEQIARLAVARGYPSDAKVQVADSNGVLVLEVPIATG